MNPNIEYEIPTLNQTYDMLLTQAQKIRTINYTPDLVVAIKRGGIIPARILSDLLEIQKIDFIEIQYYIGIAKTTEQPAIKQALTASLQKKRVLLVDDICDSGKTLQLAKTHLNDQGANQIRTATLYTKPQCIMVPDYYEKQTSRWVVFPWDAKETIRKIRQSAQGKRALNREVAKLVKAGMPAQLAERLQGEVEEQQ